MAAELQGIVPVPSPYTPTLVNRSWRDVQREYFWSFRWIDFSIPTPITVTAGTVTLTRGLTTVTGDAAASAAWAAIPSVTPITSQQFRVGQGTFYNVISISFTVPTAAVLTLDRAYVDTPVGAGSSYQIYEVYYFSPVKNFVWFDDIRDPVTGYSLATTKTRSEVGRTDPQRLQLGFPTAVIPYQINLQPGNFYGFPMFEMWPAPQQGLTYVASGYCSEKDFDNTNPGFSDTVIPPLGEDVVMERAKMLGYEWAIANPKTAGPGDFKYLHGMALKEYKRLVNQYIFKDEEYSKRNTIPKAESDGYALNLPWVDMAQGIAVFPG
jgi:hypothetical protein